MATVFVEAYTTQLALIAEKMKISKIFLIYITDI